MKTQIQTNEYGRPSIGCYFDHANYSIDELTEAICELAMTAGWKPDAEALAIINADMDNERSDGPDSDRTQALLDCAYDAESWLNEQETRSFLYWANEGECGSFGLWPSVDSAREDCDFVSSKEQEYPDDDFRGEWLHVNDHGNCTLYVREDAPSNPKSLCAGPYFDREIWSVV